MKNIYMVAIFFLLSVSWCRCALADVKKAVLIKEIEQTLTDSLRKQARPDAKDGNRALIAKRVNRIITPLKEIPMTDIPDDIASWIRESVLLVTHPSFRFADDYAPAAEQVEGFAAQIDIGAKKLDLQRARIMFQRKKYLEDSAAAYLSSFKAYWLDFLSDQDEFIVTVPNYSTTGIGTFNFGNLARTLPLLRPHEFDARKIDVQDKTIESYILSAAFALQFQKAFDKFSEMDGTYSNLFSGAFDDGDPLNTAEFRDFDAIKEELDTLRARGFIVDKDENKLRVNNAMIFEILWVSLLLRGQAKAPDLSKYTATDSLEITFKNDKNVWKMVH